MAIAKEGLGLTLLGLLVLLAVFVFQFQGLLSPVSALISMAAYLIIGAILGFSLLFIAVGLLIAFS